MHINDQLLARNTSFMKSFIGFPVHGIIELFEFPLRTVPIICPQLFQRESFLRWRRVPYFPGGGGTPSKSVLPRALWSREKGPTWIFVENPGWHLCSAFLPLDDLVGRRFRQNHADFAPAGLAGGHPPPRRPSNRLPGCSRKTSAARRGVRRPRHASATSEIRIRGSMVERGLRPFA